VSGQVLDGTLEALRPTDRLVLETLVAADALEGFRRLHLGEQERFLAWIAKASDEPARQRRIANLVMAMRMVSPAP
jgi:hypothetical protein